MLSLIYKLAYLRGFVAALLATMDVLPPKTLLLDHINGSTQD